MKKFSYAYPRPMVTVDIVLFALKRSIPSILLVKRLKDPYAGLWALPGGFVEMEEDLITAAYRELLEETGLEADSLYQLCTVGTPGRDPRGRTISVVYSGFYNKECQPVGGSDAKDACWQSIAELPLLAFDHNRITATVMKRWKSVAGYASCSVRIHPAILSAFEKYIIQVDSYEHII
ncbi:MAG: NUDIX hydrolase [Candidatus Auribacterota bacterium]|nr:NUDIX hydrolase [Candidatus Auribacterota bacterium]